MSLEMQMAGEDESGSRTTFYVAQLPDRCAICKKGGQPTVTAWYLSRKNGRIYGVFRCPNNDCRGMYLGVYVMHFSGASISGSLQTLALHQFVRELEFPADIRALSPTFCKIFHQSLVAEENGLDQICGAGFRKALEFLVKDFLIKHQYNQNPKEQNQIEGLFLAKAIKDHIKEEHVKQCAARATWLGNDETHYVRIWTNKDIQDLKALIRIVLNFIDMKIQADRYIGAMDEKGPGELTPKAPTAT
jgi:hypothetical protein